MSWSQPKAGPGRGVAGASRWEPQELKVARTCGFEIQEVMELQGESLAEAPGHGVSGGLHGNEGGCLWPSEKNTEKIFSEFEALRKIGKLGGLGIFCM